MAKLIKKVKLRKQRTELLMGIPTAIVQLMDLTENDKVEVTYENGELTVRKVVVEVVKEDE